MDVPENYENVKMILESLKVEGVEYTTQADLKLLVILVGKASGRPTFGCPFCSSQIPYTTKGDLYCLHDLQQLHNDFSEARAESKQQKDYQNVIHPPLIVGKSDQLVLGLLALPELHLMICIVDKLLTGIENNVFPTKEQGVSFMDSFLKQICNNLYWKKYLWRNVFMVNIVRKSYMGQHSLEVLYLNNNCK